MTYQSMKYLKLSRKKRVRYQFDLGSLWVASSLKLTSMSRYFLSLPTSPEADGHHIWSTGAHLLLSQSSASSCVSHGILGWLEREKQERRKELMSSSKGMTFILPCPQSPINFLLSGLQKTAASPRSWSQEAEILWLSREGNPGSGSPPGFQGAGGWLCCPLGVFVRLRVLWCDDLSEQFVLGSLQAEEANRNLG